MPPTHSPLTALEQRVRSDGARPLLTWYDIGSGARIELSSTTFANWVDKTCNLFGTLGLDDEPVVGLPLVHDHPGHWMSWVWVFATWQAGGRVLSAPRAEVGMVDLAVIGPEDPKPVPGAETVACSLHPLGLGFTHPLTGVTDAREVLSEPDVHQPGAPAADDPWWSTGDTTLTGNDLASVPAITGRVLVVADDPDAVLTAIVGVVLGGGSLVLVDGEVDHERVQAIRSNEQATA